jgi:hypothetical protein
LSFWAFVTEKANWEQGLTPINADVFRAAARGWFGFLQTAFWGTQKKVELAKLVSGRVPPLFLNRAVLFTPTVRR